MFDREINETSMSEHYKIRPMQDHDLAHVRQLEARVYGPGRFARTAYRLRESGEQCSELCLTVWNDKTLAGAVRFTHISLGNGCTGALLGPLTVNPDHAGRNLGIRLIEAATEIAKNLDLDALILVGDAPYYARAGFKPAPMGHISLPGPVAPERILVYELTQDILEKCGGLVQARHNNPRKEP